MPLLDVEFDSSNSFYLNYMLRNLVKIFAADCKVQGLVYIIIHEITQYTNSIDIPYFLTEGKDY